MAELEDLQNTTNLAGDVRDILGLKLWQNVKSSVDVSEKISVLTDFIVDSYGIFFNQEDKIGDEAFSLELLTSLTDNDFETTDEIINSIININQVVEEEDFIDDDIKVNIKTILVYMLELLQDEPQETNQIGKYSSLQGTFRPLNESKYVGDSNPKFKSKLELKMMTFCDKSPLVTKWSYERIVIPYTDKTRNNSRHNYYTDCKVTMKTKTGFKTFLVELSLRKKLLHRKIQ